MTNEQEMSNAHVRRPVAEALETIQQGYAARIVGTEYAHEIKDAAERAGIRVFVESGPFEFYSISIDDDPGPIAI